MRLNKYSQTKDGSTVVGSFADQKKSSGSSSSNNGNFRLYRDLWGNTDTGDDIEGDITVNGNIFAGEVTYSEDDDEETPDADEKHEFPSETGNIYAENNIEAGKEINSPEVYGKELYLDYEGEKVNILDLFKQLEEKLGSSGGGSGDCGSPTNPVVLLSGKLVRYFVNDYGGGMFQFDGAIKDCFTIPQTIYSSEGTITLDFTLNALKYTGFTVTAIHVTQASSGMTSGHDYGIVSGRGPGAHFFEARMMNSRTAVIREFHKTDDDKDSWISDSWTGQNGVSSVYVTVIGYATPLFVDTQSLSEKEQP